MVPLNGEVEIKEIRIKDGYCLFKHFPCRGPYGAKLHSYSYSTLKRRGRGNLGLKDGKLIMKKEPITIEDDNGKTHEIEIVNVEPEGMLLRYLGIKK